MLDVLAAKLFRQRSLIEYAERCALAASRRTADPDLEHDLLLEARAARCRAIELEDGKP